MTTASMRVPRPGQTRLSFVGRCATSRLPADLRHIERGMRLLMRVRLSHFAQPNRWGNSPVAAPSISGMTLELFFKSAPSSRSNLIEKQILREGCLSTHTPGRFPTFVRPSVLVSTSLSVHLNDTLSRLGGCHEALS